MLEMIYVERYRIFNFRQAFTAFRPRDHLTISQRMRRPVKRLATHVQRSVKELTNNIVVSTNERRQMALQM